MNPEAMKPHGKAMQAFFQGDADAELIIHRDDGQVSALPVRHFFRDAHEFSPIESVALSHCRGRVLDVGAGTGLHSLVLQAKGRSVTAMDISPWAVEIMKQRGVEDVLCADILDFHDSPFDTILIMGHGIGIVETTAGLDRFLDHVPGLLSKEGQVLLDSLDVRITDDPTHLAYHETNREAGRYFGETRLRFEFQGEHGPECGWLHVDPDTLRERAEAVRGQCEVILKENTGDYLAKLWF